MNPFSKENREKRKLKRADWKKYKKEKRKMKRASLKEEYANAPVLTRFFHVNAHRIIVTLIWAVVVLSVLGIILTDEDFIAGEICKHSLISHFHSYLQDLRQQNKHRKSMYHLLYFQGAH